MPKKGPEAGKYSQKKMMSQLGILHNTGILDIQIYFDYILLDYIIVRVWSALTDILILPVLGVPRLGDVCECSCYTPNHQTVHGSHWSKFNFWFCHSSAEALVDFHSVTSAVGLYNLACWAHVHGMQFDHQ